MELLEPLPRVELLLPLELLELLPPVVAELLLPLELLELLPPVATELLLALELLEVPPLFVRHLKVGFGGKSILPIHLKFFIAKEPVFADKPSTFGSEEPTSSHDQARTFES